MDTASRVWGVSRGGHPPSETPAHAAAPTFVRKELRSIKFVIALRRKASPRVHLVKCLIFEPRNGLRSRGGASRTGEHRSLAGIHSRNKPHFASNRKHCEPRVKLMLTCLFSRYSVGALLQFSSTLDGLVSQFVSISFDHNRLRDCRFAQVCRSSTAREAYWASSSTGGATHRPSPCDRRDQSKAIQQQCQASPRTEGTASIRPISLAQPSSQSATARCSGSKLPSRTIDSRRLPKKLQ